MALGFKIADGYVEVHADYDRSELRDAAQDAANDFDDAWGRERERDIGAERARGKRVADHLLWGVDRQLRRNAQASINNPLTRAVNQGRDHHVSLGRRIARNIGIGLNHKPTIGNAATSFFRSFIEAVSFGQADIGGARPNTAFARWASRAGVAIGVTLATALILKAAEMIVALSPLLLASLAAIPIVFLSKTDKQVKAALKAWKKDAADFMRFVSQPIKIPFLKSLQEIRDGFDRMRGPVRAFFAAVGAGLPALARGGMDFLLNFFKALKPVLPNLTLGLKLWGVELGKIGGAIGKAFQIFLKDPDLLRKSIQGFSGFLQGLIKVFANLVVGLSYVSASIGNFIRLIQIGFANSILPQWLSGVTAKWGPLKAAIVDAWNAFKKFATAEGDEQIVTRFRTLMDRIKAIWGPLKDFLGQVFKLAWDGVKLIWSTYVIPWWEGTALPWLKTKLKEGARWAFEAMKEAIKAELLKLPGMAQAELEKLKNRIKERLQQAVTDAKAKAQQLVDGVVTWLKGLPGKAASAVSGLWGRMQGAFTSAASNARAKAVDLVNRVVTFLRTLPGKARSAVSNLWGSMVGAFNSAVSQARSAAVRLVNGFIAALRTIIGKARSAAQSARSAITGVFSGAGSWLVGAGRNIAAGLANGIRAGLSWVTSAARNLAAAAKNAAMSALGISSPSKVFAEEVGVPAAQGIAVGLRKQFPAEMMDLRNAMPKIRMPETAMAGAAAGGPGGSGFSPTVNLYMQPGFYSENAAAKRALTKDVFLALEQYRKDYVNN